MNIKNTEQAQKLIKERKFEEAIISLAGSSNRQKRIAVKRGLLLALSENNLTDEDLDALFDFLMGRKQW